MILPCPERLQRVALDAGAPSAAGEARNGIKTRPRKLSQMGALSMWIREVVFPKTVTLADPARMVVIPLALKKNSA